MFQPIFFLPRSSFWWFSFLFFVRFQSLNEAVLSINNDLLFCQASSLDTLLSLVHMHHFYLSGLVRRSWFAMVFIWCLKLFEGTNSLPWTISLWNLNVSVLQYLIYSSTCICSFHFALSGQEVTASELFVLYCVAGHLLAPLVAHIFCNFMGLPVLFSRRKGM